MGYTSTDERFSRASLPSLKRHLVRLKKRGDIKEVTSALIEEAIREIEMHRGFHNDYRAYLRFIDDCEALEAEKERGEDSKGEDG